MAKVKFYQDSRATDTHERWLISYADFITLLFAFFVVMYAVSSVNEAKYRVMGQAIGSAFGTAPAVQIAPVAQGVRPPVRSEALVARHRERLAQTAGVIEAAVAPLSSDGNVRVTRSARGVTVEIGAGALFSPAQATLRADARAALAELARALRTGDQPVEVEGHTDDTPLRSAQFASNWELSAARASSVVRLLAENGVAPARMAAIGFGEFRPVDSSATPEGRARNRRVAVTVIAPEPGAAPERPAQPFAPIEFKVQPPR